MTNLTLHLENVDNKTLANTYVLLVDFIGNNNFPLDEIKKYFYQLIPIVKQLSEKDIFPPETVKNRFFDIKLNYLSHHDELIAKLAETINIRELNQTKEEYIKTLLNEDVDAYGMEEELTNKIKLAIEYLGNFYYSIKDYYTTGNKKNLEESYLNYHNVYQDAEVKEFIGDNIGLDQINRQISYYLFWIFFDNVDNDFFKDNPAFFAIQNSPAYRDLLPFYFLLNQEHINGLPNMCSNEEGYNNFLRQMLLKIEKYCALIISQEINEELIDYMIEKNVNFDSLFENHSTINNIDQYFSYLLSLNKVDSDEAGLIIDGNVMTKIRHHQLTIGLHNNSKNNTKQKTKI